MLEQTRTIFEVLERAWRSQDCTLVDMKIEFGVDVETGKMIGPLFIDFLTDLYRYLLAKKGWSPVYFFADAM